MLLQISTKKILRCVAFLLVFLQMGTHCFSQVVWTEPAFPSQEDDIKLFYDATQGNGALETFATVYAHTGVITSNSNNANDWQHVQGNWGTPDPNVLMQSEGNNIYSLSFNINDFYGVEPGEIVDKLAFVFRNADGSTVGRAADGEDIFFDLTPENEFSVNIISPADNSIVQIAPATVDIELQTSEKAFVEIFLSGNSIFQDSTSSVDFSEFLFSLGNQKLEFKFSTVDTSFSLFRTFVVLNDAYPIINIPPDAVNGLNYLEDGKLGFKLTAPIKWHVFLLCPANNYSPNIDYLMLTNGLGDFWVELDSSLFTNGQNNYQYLIDPTFINEPVKLADPFSTVVLDPSNDDEVEPEVLNRYGSYPDGLTTGRVTAFDLEPEDFNWTDANFEKPTKSNLVIYELLLRDFLADHSFESLIDTLDYLDNLGVTAIELMPINEFEGNNSWGYNPSFHMAVDKYYGSTTELKQFINACHERGIAVINDVVFNHAFSQSPLCQMYWNAADFRPAANSPYLNETPRHPFNVGFDFNHESDLTKDWVKQILSYWIEEFHFDGFRFDLSKGFTQRNSGNNAGLMAQFDQGRIDILTDYADHIWSHDSDAYMICEHFADNDDETVLSDYGMMLWANTTFQFAEAAMGYISGFSQASYRSRGWDEPNLIAYAESHDEERMAYKIDTWGNSTSSYNVKETWTKADRIIATNMIYLSIPGPKMLWQFGELGYDFSINTCENGTVNDNCRLSLKPVRWDYQEQESRAYMYDRISALLKLRKEQEFFKTEDFDIPSDSYTKRVILRGNDIQALSIANFDVIPKDINPQFPSTGTWYDFFTGEAIEITDPEAIMSFDPGEYHLYLTEPLMPEDGFISSSSDLQSERISLSPNPLKTGDYISWCSHNSIDILSVNLISIDGRTQQLDWQKGNSCLEISTTGINAGFYYVQLESDQGRYHSSVIITE